MLNVNYSLSLRLAEKLTEQHKLLALAESCTGGGLASTVTAVQGASQWFERGFVVYSNESKQELLNVPRETIEVYGAVSPETAMAMASGALLNSHADISLSITGVAGPGGGTDQKPVGTVWFGLANREGLLKARHGQFTSGRKNVRTCSIEFALSWLLEALS